MFYFRKGTGADGPTRAHTQTSSYQDVDSVEAFWLDILRCIMTFFASSTVAALDRRDLGEILVTRETDVDSYNSPERGYCVYSVFNIVAGVGTIRYLKSSSVFASTSPGN